MKHQQVRSQVLAHSPERVRGVLLVVVLMNQPTGGEQTASTKVTPVAGHPKLVTIVVYGSLIIRILGMLYLGKRLRVSAYTSLANRKAVTTAVDRYTSIPTITRQHLGEVRHYQTVRGTWQALVLAKVNGWNFRNPSARH